MKANRDWGVWAGANIAALVVMERRALTEDRRNKLEALNVPCPTLSTTLRHWLGINPRKKRRLFFIPGLIGFALWFLHHIILDYEMDDIIDAINDAIEEAGNANN